MAVGRDKFAQGIVVRLFRLWSASRACALDHNPMRELVVRLGLPYGSVPACVSFFELVEAQLGRRLEAGSCCSRRLTADEQALLGVMQVAPTVGSAMTTEQVPHGLPAAIGWSAVAVRRSFGLDGSDEPAAGYGGPPQSCPFQPVRAGAEAPRGV